MAIRRNETTALVAPAIEQSHHVPRRGADRRPLPVDWPDSTTVLNHNVVAGEVAVDQRARPAFEFSDRPFQSFPHQPFETSERTGTTALNEGLPGKFRKRPKKCRIVFGEMCRPHQFANPTVEPGMHPAQPAEGRLPDAGLAVFQPPVSDVFEAQPMAVRRVV